MASHGSTLAQTDNTADDTAREADLACARRVLDLEAEGLTALGRGLDGVFIHALDLMAKAQGRVVVTGMGKSGHVGCKIAATLASTGTPAFFVHPGEASHGDLGMITAQDVVLALSNSGETPELSDILAFSRRFAIPLVAITSKGESTLARAADAALVLPRVSEACPLGLAPTTSTTMTLALGDALAVALLERRGFTAADFQVFHPGGKLGQRLLKVADLMHSGEEMPLVRLGTPMSDAILTMTAKSFGVVGVLDDAGALAGIITDGDLRRHMSPEMVALPAEQVMTPAPKTVSSGILAAEALRVMNARAITTLFVEDAGRPAGILHIHDLLRAGVA